MFDVLIRNGRVVDGTGNPWFPADVAIEGEPLVAHGALRIHEVGFEGRELTPDELARMRDRLRAAMEEGAWGLSTGLLYAPGIFAPPEEIEALAAELAPFGGLYASHIRGSS